jgi:hypothetical protein
VIVKRGTILINPDGNVRLSGYVWKRRPKEQGDTALLVQRYAAKWGIIQLRRLLENTEKALDGS